MSKIIVLLGIFMLFGVFSIFFNPSFASCAVNEDWHDAPCFDVLPVNREEYRAAWAPYYDYKGSEWMELKKIEMFDAKDNERLAEWMDRNIANHNVFSYYLSRGEISFPPEYDRPFFEDDFRYYLQFTQVWLFFVVVAIVLGLTASAVFIIKKKKKMKKIFVIIPIIAVLIVSITTVSLLYNQEIMLATGMMTVVEEPESIHIPDPICFVGKATSGEKGDAMSSEACFPLSYFENLGCDRSVLEYIYKYTSLLDKEFDGIYLRNVVGLPEGVSEEEYEKCANSIHEKRKTMSENMGFDPFSIVEGTIVQLEGVIMDMRLGTDHQYSFFTNDPRYTFNTGSNGITLEGINNKDDLHGKVVNLSGIRTQRDLGIKVDDLVVTGSLIPSPKIANPVLTAKDILNVSLDDLYENPDKYYNRFVRIAGELREYENDLAYAGVGCYTAKYTTSDEFVSDFPSSRHLHDGDKNIGVRIETPDDLGRVEEPLPDELKTNKVTVMGIFVPNVVERGDCDHVIHKSGFLLTKLDDIKMVE